MPRKVYVTRMEWWEEILWWLFTLPFKLAWWLIAGPIILLVKLVRQSPKKQLQQQSQRGGRGTVISAVKCQVCGTLNEAGETACFRCHSPLD